MEINKKATYSSVSPKKWSGKPWGKKPYKPFLLHEKFGMGGTGAIAPAVDEGNRKDLASMKDEYNRKVAEKKKIEKQTF